MEAVPEQQISQIFLHLSASTYFNCHLLRYGSKNCCKTYNGGLVIGSSDHPLRNLAKETIKKIISLFQPLFKRQLLPQIIGQSPHNDNRPHILGTGRRIQPRRQTHRLRGRRQHCAVLCTRWRCTQSIPRAHGCGKRLLYLYIPSRFILNCVTKKIKTDQL